MNSLLPKMAGLLVAVAVACNPVLAHSGGHHHSTSTSSGTRTKTVHVSGYLNSHGTYVAPHDRAAPTKVPSASKPTSSASSTSRSISYYGERDARGRFVRSTKAKDDFKHLQPCPFTGTTSGSCPGYVIDHIIPLKRGGRDAPSNMQWQTVEAAKAKDKIE